MTTHNLWYYFLYFMQEFLLSWFLPFLPYHVDWGLAEVISTNAGPILGLVFITAGSFIHVGTLVRIFQYIVIMEFVKAILALRKLVARVIKWATVVGFFG